MTKFFSFLAAILMGILTLPSGAHGQQILPVSGAAALQQALDGVPDGGIIEVAAGTYAASPGGWTIYSDLSGGTRSFTVRAAPGASVVLTGNGTMRILTLPHPSP